MKTFDGYKKQALTDVYALLAGGGHKPLSEFSMAHTHPYLPLSGGTITGNIILKGGTSPDMTYAGNVHPYIRFDNSDSSLNISLIFTDYDSYRRPAGIKLVGNQGNEWFEAANIYATTFYGALSGNASSATNADKVDGYHATDGRTFNGNINWSGNWNDAWSDGTHTHPWYGFDHRYPNTGAYSTTISDFFGMTIKTANILRLDFGTLLLNGTNIYNINVASATRLQTARTIWGQSFNGTANVDNTLRIRQTTGNYCEGIRIQTADGAWSTIILGATADSGTNTNAWSIHRKADNNFAISRNSSDGINGLVMTSVGMGLGTTAPTHRLDVRGDTKITGSITASSAFINTGDSTLKVYSGRITDAKSDGNMCLQTSIDGTDGQSHTYPTQYGARCNLVLLPRGGQVYIGTNPDGGNTTYKLYTNGDIYSSTYIRATNGFVKGGSSNSYVLLGGGDHKLESNLSVAYSKYLTGITLTGGNGNNSGYRLIFEKTMGAWTINYGVWAIAFRHSGRGILNIGFDTTNSDGSTYIYNIRFFGSTAARESTPFRAFYNTTTKVFRIYWHYYDYTSGDIAVLRGDMHPYNGTWLTSLPDDVGTELTITYNTADYATNSDTIDGYHANGLLTALSNSNNGVSITVGGTTKSISNISVNYANSAGNASTAIALSSVIANDKLPERLREVTTSYSGRDANTIPSNGFYYCTSNINGLSDANILQLAHTNSSWRHQLMFKFGGTVGTGTGYDGKDLWTRLYNGNSKTWTEWYRILTSGNFNAYVPTKTGGGASGTWGISITGNAATATNADKVDGYHASSLWRSDGATWNPGANVSLNASGNNQEWSFDIRRNGYTGCYWHVWDSALNSMLKVNADNGKVYAPYNFVGNLEGNASSATTATKLASSGYANNALSYYQTDQAFDGSATGWAHYIIANHHDGASYYHYTIRLPFWSVPQYRRLTGNTSNVTSWYNFITAENISSQSVNYATSAGNADTLDGLHANAFATASHSHPYLPLSGGTMTGVIKSTFSSSTWINGVTNAIVKGEYTGYGAILSMPVKTGRVSLSSYPANDNNIYFGYATTAQISAGTNSFNKQMYWDAANNNLHANVFTGSLAGNASTATNATNADKVDGLHFNWNNNKNDHTYLWAATDNGNAYLVHRASISVNYANSSNYANSTDRAKYLSGHGVSPNNSHPGHGARVFYSWDIGQVGNDTAGYSNGITIGSNPGDTNYGFQIVQNMWDDRTYTRRYNGGWQSWKTLAWTSDIPTKSSWNYDDVYSKLGHTHDDRYYTESEVNNLLSNKLNISNFNWTNLSGKLVAGNEFNIVNAGFNSSIWFNHSPINDRSKTASINGYHFGNGAGGYTSIKASGFIKNGSSSSYVLLGDGGHKAESSLSVSYASSAGNADTLDGNHASAFASSSHTHSYITISTCSSLDGNSNNFSVEYAGGSNSVATKPRGVDAFGVMRLRTAGGWYGQIMMSANAAPGMYYRNANGLSSSVEWKKLLDSSNFGDYAATKSHTHAISQITNLQTTLDGKAAASHIHSYLPLAGGTMTGTIKYGEKSYEIIRTGGDNTTWRGGLKYSWSGNTTIALWGKHSSTQFVWHAGTDFSSVDVNGTTTRTYDFQVGRVNGTLEALVGGNKIWHAGNDGSGSGLDADTVDGYHASSFATSWHTHTLSLASDTGSSSIALVHGGKYKLTAGGNSIIFTLPTSSSINPTNFYWANVKVSASSSTTTSPTFSKVMVNTTSSSYQLNVGGDSYTTGWSRAINGFCCENNSVYFTHNTSLATVGEIDIASSNEFCWGANNNILYFNYRKASRGTTVNSYVWNAGSSSSYASHTTGHITLGGSGYLIKRVGCNVSWVNGRNSAIVRQTSASGYSVVVSSKTTNGSWEIGNYTSNGDNLYFTHISDSNYNRGNNTFSGQLYFSSNGSILANNVEASGSMYATHFYENSDIRYKKILKNLSINSNIIANLPLFDFEWIENNTIGTGTSALAVQQILPNLVSGTDKLTLDYGVLGTIAGITACKELVTLKSELLQLKEKVKLLEDKLRKYENI